MEFSSCFPFCGGFGDYEDYDYYGGSGSGEGSGDQDYDYDTFSGTTSQTCVGTTCILNLHHTSLTAGPGGRGRGGDVRVINCRGSPRSSSCDGSLCRVSCWDGSEVSIIPIIPLSSLLLCPGNYRLQGQRSDLLDNNWRWLREHQGGGPVWRRPCQLSALLPFL